MKECEECKKKIAKSKAIQVKIDITRYFCDWECLSLYCGEMLKV